jgi:hypothetical protein
MEEMAPPHLRNDGFCPNVDFILADILDSGWNWRAGAGGLAPDDRPTTPGTVCQLDARNQRSNIYALT